MQEVRQLTCIIDSKVKRKHKFYILKKNEFYIVRLVTNYFICQTTDNQNKLNENLIVHIFTKTFKHTTKLYPEHN